MSDHRNLPRRFVVYGMPALVAALATSVGCDGVARKAPSRSTAAHASQAVADGASPGSRPRGTVETPVVGTGDVAKDYRVIWVRKPPSLPPGQACFESSAVYLTRVGVNPKFLYVELSHEVVNPTDPEETRWGKVEVPRVDLLGAGVCDLPPPKLTSVMRFGQQGARFFIPRQELPLGDFWLEFHAFDSMSGLLFANDEKGLRTISGEEEMKNYSRIPDDGSGQGPSVGLTQIDCSVYARPRATAKPVGALP